MDQSLADYRWLVGPDGQAVLSRIHDQPRRHVSPSFLATLRKELTPGQVHVAVEQMELRNRAAEKFSDADKLFFTKKGLEQATDEQLARYKAERFTGGAPVADVCSGIGGDLLALAARGPAVGIDSDPIIALLAEANLAALGLTQSRVETAEASVASLSGTSAWHCDPDRRTTNHRTTKAEYFSPGPSVLDGLLNAAASAAIKLAPATEAPNEWQFQAEREWLGSRRECRQQVAWFGGLARHPGKRVATIVEGAHRRTIVEGNCSAPAVADRLGRYIHEPQSAVLAAKLSGPLCEEYGLALVSSSVAYLSGDAPLQDLALDTFEVVDLLPFDRKRLRSYCRQQGLGQLEIKKRGVDVDPQRLRKEVAAKGENAATIILSPVAGKVMAVIARRLQ